MNKEILLSYKILKEIYFNNAYSSIELNKQYNKNLNFNLVTKIVYGVLDNNVKYDYYLDQFINNKTKKQVKLLLKIATFINFEVDGIPKYALGNEIVNVAKNTELKPYYSFINAVINKIATTNLVLPNKNNYKKFLSVKFSKPIWFINLLFNNMSRNEVENYLNFNCDKLTNIRVNTNIISINNFVEKLNENKITYKNNILNDAFLVDYEQLLKFDDLKNLYTVQGLPSMVVSRNVTGNNILDACSAPGGKANYIALLNQNSKVIACDIHNHRVKLINDYIKKTKLTNIETKLCDATKFNCDFVDKFDTILLDVPCSGLGVINKKPDILLNINEKEINNLPNIQYAILSNNAKYLKTNGEIIYSTCTINKKENENILKKFLKEHNNFELLEVNTYGIKTIGEKYKTFLPHISNTEGFFIGRIRKND